MQPQPAAEATRRGTARPFYLQLHFDVLYSPEVRLFCALWRCALLDILAYAVRSEEPGVITIAPGQLARLCGFRKFERFQEFLSTLEERRIIAFRKEDDCIVVNPALIPQVPATAGGDAFPRRRRPSEMPEALRERKQKSRQTALKMDDAPAPKVDECHDSNRDMSHHRTTEDSIEQQQQPALDPAIVNPTAEGAGEAVVVVSTAPPPDPDLQALLDAGITAATAEQLLTTHGAEIVRAQLAYLPHRKNRTDKAATLVIAIAQNWPAPAKTIPKPSPQRNEIAKLRAAEDRERQAAAKREANDRAAADIVRARMSHETREQLRRQAVATLSPELKRALDIRGDRAPIVAAAIEAAERLLLQKGT